MIVCSPISKKPNSGGVGGSVWFNVIIRAKTMLIAIIVSIHMMTIFLGFLEYIYNILLNCWWHCKLGRNRCTGVYRIWHYKGSYLWFRICLV